MERRISGHTQLYALIGSPVGHSGSPAMYNYSFEKLGIDAAYLAFDVPVDKTKDAIDALRTLHAGGFNVTMPCKTATAQLVDRLSPAAELVGACNTVVIEEDGTMTGHMTDGTGFVRNLKEHGVDIKGKKIVLLGTGGAATAIAVQAALDGVRGIDLFARPGASWDALSQVVSRVNESTDCRICMYELRDTDQMRKSIEDSAILVNASSVGMSPREDGCLLPDASYLRPELIVSDVIYNPRETRFLKMAKKAGCPAFNGLYMLLYQGAYAFSLWTGKEMPVELIKEKYFR